MMGGMMGGMGAWMLVFPVFAILLFATLLVVGLVGARALATRDENGVESDPEETPVERLQRRYAEGELTEAAFERELERELEREEAEEAEPSSAGSTEQPQERERKVT